MIREITISQLWTKMGNIELVALVEVGPLEAYERGHLVGALHARPERAGELIPQYVPNRGAELVLYDDSGGAEGPARRAAEVLHRLGYEEIFVLAGGRQAWARDGQALESGHVPAAS